MYYIGCNVENTQIFLYIGGKVKNYTLTEGHKEHRVSEKPATNSCREKGMHLLHIVVYSL